VAGLSFCPGCGFNTAEIGQPSAPAAADQPDPPLAAIWPQIDADPSAPSLPGAATTGNAPTVKSASHAAPRPLERRPSARTLIVGGLIVAIGLIIVSQLTRPKPGGVPATLPGPGGQQPGGSSGGPALIVGLTIQSPQDGQQVATKEVTVIGMAPPGLSITRDVSLGLDQHATADGTGHWAMNVGLDQGENKLKFRIGDDRSTEQTLRVIYTPQAP
jgi:hypothetical protein